MSLRYPSDDSELRQIVRSETGYEDSPDELPQSRLDILIERAKGKVELTTGSTKWYSDKGLGYALAAYTAMRAKASMENVSLEGYTFGAESVTFADTDPETSQQLQQWAEDVKDGLDFSSVDTQQGVSPRNTSGYIGETYTREESL